MPSAIEQVHRDFKDRGLAVLAISVRDTPAKVDAWVRARNVSFPIALDLDGTTARAYRVTSYPTVVIVTRDGKLTAMARGARPWTNERGRAFFEGLVALH